MLHKYSLATIFLCSFFCKIFTTENPFDTELSERIEKDNPDIAKLSKDTMQNLTGSLLSLKAEPDDSSSNPLKTEIKPEEDASLAKVLAIIDTLPNIRTEKELTSMLNDVALVKHLDNSTVLARIQECLRTMPEDQATTFQSVLLKTVTSEKDVNFAKKLLEKTKQKDTYLKDFVERYNKDNAKEIENGTKCPMIYCENSEQLSPTDQEELIKELKRTPFMNSVFQFYKNHKLIAITGGMTLIAGICALIYKAYKKYCIQKNNSQNTPQQQQCTLTSHRKAQQQQSKIVVIARHQ